MNWNILLNSARPIPLHAFAAFASIALGGVQLALKKGTKSHRFLGLFWVLLMGIVSVSSFFIHELNVFWGYSPIHFLSIWTLISLYFVVYHARKGNIRKHKRWTQRLYVLALIVTGFFTFYPGRIMYQVFFGAT